MTAMLDFVARIAFLCRKELLMLVKDPSSRALIFVPALMQSLLFGYGATYDLTYAPYAVLDQSGGAASTRLLAKLTGTGVFERVATLRAAPEIADVIDSGQVLLVLSFPADFESRLAAGQGAPLQVILDGRNSTTAGAAAGQVGAIVAAYNQEMRRRTADHDRTPRLVQPESGVALEHHAGADRRAQHAADPACWRRCRWRASESRAPSTSCS